MMIAFGLGTYRCRNVTAAAQVAVAAGVEVIDTAPVYADGTAHSQLARVLASYPDVRVSTKVGHMTREQARTAVRARAISAHEAARCHSLDPGYLDYQIAANIAELRRKCLDLLYLHNPEHEAHGDRDRLLDKLTRAFATCEKAAYDGLIAGYGIATWNGFTSGAFTVEELTKAAWSAAGSTDTHLKAVQLPINLIQLAPLAAALDGDGPVAHARRAGLEVWASAPLGGGELIDIITTDLATLISPGLSPAAAALAVAASTPGLTGVLVSASSTSHWQDALCAFRRPPITLSHLREICCVLRT